MKKMPGMANFFLKSMKVHSITAWKLLKVHPLSDIHHGTRSHSIACRQREDMRTLNITINRISLGRLEV